MDRQRCVLGAILNQADPLNVLKSYRSLARGIKNVIATDLTTGALNDLIKVSGKTKNSSITSVTFTNQVIDSSNPDIAYIRANVQQAIAKSNAIKAAPSATASPKATKKPTKKPTTTPKPAPAAPGQPVELADTCSYT
jgi:anionic cell wall polymer biosynthesis LytR-Cps2A-Psr (LCP) family protein